MHQPEGSPEPPNIVYLSERFADSERLTPEFRRTQAYELATDILFTDLILHHPLLRRRELAEAILTALTPPKETNAQTTRLHVALLELVSADADIIASTSDSRYMDIFDDKSENDPVFKQIVKILRDTADLDKTLSAERKAARTLCDLRELSLDHVTPRDHDWEAVIGRLFDLKSRSVD